VREEREEGNACASGCEQIQIEGFPPIRVKAGPGGTKADADAGRSANRGRRRPNLARNRVRRSDQKKVPRGNLRSARVAK